MSYHIRGSILTNSFAIMDGATLVGWFNQSGVDTSEGVANAKLFAAAPDLLEACQQAAKWIEKHGYDYTYEYDTLRAAIDKAQ